MQPHEHHAKHLSAAKKLGDAARAAGNTALASAADAHAAASEAAAKTHATTTDLKERAKATAPLMRTGADALEAFSNTPTPTLAEAQAGLDTMKELGDAISASV